MFPHNNKKSHVSNLANVDKATLNNLDLQGLDNTTLQLMHLPTPLGPMVAIGDEQALYLLTFDNTVGLTRSIAQLSKRIRATINPGWSSPLASIKEELIAYFEGKLIEFKTPVRLLGTPFQQQAWNALITIPYGQTKSYAEQARQIDRPTAYRAVAHANATNFLTLAIPCHRIINNNGKLGGYGGELHRKQWLIDHEKRIIDQGK